MPGATNEREGRGATPFPEGGRPISRKDKAGRRPRPSRSGWFPNSRFFEHPVPR
jgi:hypothetical protein